MNGQYGVRLISNPGPLFPSGKEAMLYAMQHMDDLYSIVTPNGIEWLPRKPNSPWWPLAERLFSELCDTYADLKDIEIHWVCRRSRDDMQTLLQRLGIDIYHPNYMEFRDEFQYAEVVSNREFQARFC